MTAIHIRRWRRRFLLVIVDHDTDRFTIEGPMADDQAWAREIRRAQRAGRQISCWALDGELEAMADTAREWERVSGRTRWPAGSILSPDPAPEGVSGVGQDKRRAASLGHSPSPRTPRSAHADAAAPEVTGSAVPVTAAIPRAR